MTRQEWELWTFIKQHTERVKEMANKKETEIPTELVFTKAQIVASKKYSPYKDFFNGNLKTGQMYSEAELNALITKNFKKGTGE